MAGCQMKPEARRKEGDYGNREDSRDILASGFWLLVGKLLSVWSVMI
jgi:hypothetical protein